MRALSTQELLTALAKRQYPNWPNDLKEGVEVSPETKLAKPGSAKAATVMHDAVQARLRPQHYGADGYYPALAGVNKVLAFFVKSGWATKERQSFRITRDGLIELKRLLSAPAPDVVGDRPAEAVTQSEPTFHASADCAGAPPEGAELGDPAELAADTAEADAAVVPAALAAARSLDIALLREELAPLGSRGPVRA